ncbi:MAG: hypothetical protein ACI9N9_002214 [Enterobacterales bacterium]|jgi:hypothetical protein
MKFISSMLDTSKYNLQQLVKITVYILLLINYTLYIGDDWTNASYTMRDGGSILEWTAAFATTIDETAWLILLLLFELETHLLSYDPLSRLQTFMMNGTKFICYLSLFHTFYAASLYVYEISMITPIEQLNNLCDLVGKGVSFTSNLSYTDINDEVCATISTSSQFYYLDPLQKIITDSPGFIIETQSAYIDIIDVTTWLLILFTVEISVWLQNRDIVTGKLLKFLNITKFFLYAQLWIDMAYWGYRDHWIYAWDQFVWIAGFIAIEKNVVDWRKEINEHENQLHSGSGSEDGIDLEIKRQSS